MATPTFLPNNPGQSDYMQALLARLQPSTGGISQTGVGPVTSTGPSVQPLQAPEARLQPMQQMQPAGNETPAAQQGRQVQNIAAGVQNLAAAVTNKMAERKQRETQQVFNRYADSVRGIQDSQAQAQQAMAGIRAAQQKLIAARQAGDPQAESAARQEMVQAQQMFGSAQESLKNNQLNLDDMFNGPKGEKHAKMIATGYGIDDKNKDTPERQAAIASIRKNMGVGETAAGLISRMPQTAQLTPQARAAQMGREAGLVSAPATQGQILKAETDREKIESQRQTAIDNRKAQFMKALPVLQAQGITLAKDAQGNPMFDDRGYPVMNTMSQEQIKANPQLALKQNLLQSQIDYNAAKEDLATNPNNIQNQARMLAAEAAMKRAQALAQATSTGNVDMWGDLLVAGKATPSEVPQNVRSASVKNAVKKSGNNFDPRQADLDLKTQQATETEYRKGKTAANVRSFNTALAHLSRLDEANRALNSGNLQDLNRIANFYGIKTGSDKQAVFDAVATAVVGELGSTFKGAAATDPEIHALRETLDKSFSKGVTRAVLEADAELIGGRIDAAQFGYDEGTNHKGTLKLLSPRSQEILNSFGLDKTGNKPKEGTTTQPGATFDWGSAPKAQ